MKCTAHRLLYTLLTIFLAIMLFPTPYNIGSNSTTAVAQGTHYTPITITNNANQDSTVEITAVSPSSIQGFIGDSVSLNVSVYSTLSDSVDVNVTLVDHDGVVRDYVVVPIGFNETVNTTLSTTLLDSDHGLYTWFVKVLYNGTVYDSVSINVTGNLEVSVSNEYGVVVNESLCAGTGISGVEHVYQISFSEEESGFVGILGTSIGHWVNMSAGLGSSTSVYGHGSGNYMIGSNYCLIIYRNNATEVNLCNATTYTITFYFIYHTEVGVVDYPDAYVQIYVDVDGRSVYYTGIYIPDGNRSVLLPANNKYTIQIPSQGKTVNGYCFELETYSVEGAGTSGELVLDRDYKIYIYYRIYESSSPPTQTSTATISLVPPPSLNATGSGWLSPSFSVGAPSIASPQGLLMLALFIGLFIVYSRVFPWGQALAVSSAVCMIISIALFGLDMFSFFLVFFVVGIGAWKILGK